MKQNLGKPKNALTLDSPNTRCRQTAIFTVDTSNQKGLSSTEKLPQVMSNKVFRLRLELLFVATCLNSLADEPFLNAFHLKFRLSKLNASKTARKPRITKN